MNTTRDRDLDTSPVIDLGLAIRRTQHLLGQRIEEDLRPLGLNLGLWVVLHEVARQSGASASELARASLITPQTLSGLLRRLQERGLVERGTTRGRIVENRLTTAGHDTLIATTRHARAVITTALAAFSPADQSDLERLLADFTDALTHTGRRPAGN